MPDQPKTLWRQEAEAMDAAARALRSLADGLPPGSATGAALTSQAEGWAVKAALRGIG